MTENKIIEGSLNALIRALGESGKIEKNNISDGYHTFGSLYAMRTQLFITLCKVIHRRETASFDNWTPDKAPSPIWKTKYYEDGRPIERGWFLMGMRMHATRQITFHLPIEKWDECYFANTLECAPAFDGHDSEDVLERLRNLS